MMTFIERHAFKILGALSCFDRGVITGTLPDICHAGAMAGHLTAKGIRLFDDPQWAQPYREELREHAERLAHDNGLEIEFIRRKDFRKEKRIKAIIAERGDHEGLVHIFSAMEPCDSFKPWHEKATGKTFFKPTEAKCLHYYFYFIDRDLGLCYLRVPTWAPFRLQFYFNGHNEPGPEAPASGDRLHLDRQRLCGHCRLPQGAGVGRRPESQAAPPTPGPAGGYLLPCRPPLPGGLPLEPDAGGVRHRCGVPQPGRLPAAV
jgi:hypothetical protein